MGLAVGAAAPSADAAMAIGPAVTVIFIVFGGVYVSGGGVPRWLRWVPRASFIKHAFEGLVVNEFEGMRFEPDAPPAAAVAGRGGGKKEQQQQRGGAGTLLTGEDVLCRFGLQDVSIASTVVAQCRVLAFHCWTTLCLLRARQPRYVAPSPVVEEEIAEEGQGKEEKEK